MIPVLLHHDIHILTYFVTIFDLPLASLRRILGSYEMEIDSCHTHLYLLGFSPQGVYGLIFDFCIIRDRGGFQT